MAQEPLERILFRQLSSSLAIPIFLVDARGDMAYFNEAAEALLGVRLDEVDEMPFAEWTTAFTPGDDDPDDQAAAEASVEARIDALPLVRAIRSRRPAHGPLEITGADGVVRQLEVTAFPLEGARGRYIGAVAMFWEAAAGA